MDEQDRIPGTLRAQVDFRKGGNHNDRPRRNDIAIEGFGTFDRSIGHNRPPDAAHDRQEDDDENEAPKKR